MATEKMQNESKAFHPSYDQRNAFVAYSLQEKHGKFNPEKARPLGALDFVGHDRRTAWTALGDLSQAEAQQAFIALLHSLCPIFRPYVAAVRCDLDDKERKRREAEEAEARAKQEAEEGERRRAEEAAAAAELEKQRKYEEQKRTIQEILNRQTIHQFSTYARQQYPDSTELQQALISQLQEQHFQQYMQQMMEQSADLLDGTMLAAGGGSGAINNNSGNQQSNNHQQEVETSTVAITMVDGSPVKTSSAATSEAATITLDAMISNASMWTRKDIATFKETIRAEGGDGILKVGHGEIATIRVPTHENGNCIFWEFATDSYDIGFGLLFEWNATPDHQVSIHISESEDEEDEEEVEGSPNDVEKGGGNLIGGGGDEEANLEMKIPPNNSSKLLGPGDPNDPQQQPPQPPPVSVIIPIYRRDAHEEVFAGSHSYPGRGVYLLKFDNSYSLWRSKTLYYRVYYTKET
ncbi:PREDICTED: Golgi resident protein GCP60-like [Rhagoletis zephyria]|uniref:Golgi resident protein GCP60-like n=1 Tax=Rhagoletis zephyria TaxID=28612 RepID=UPI00081175A1|nr:PREDICTED: Golgi resident protein GCP60-like [Rhagoletis zephyria]